MIPSAKPFLGEEEARAAGEAILSGWVTQGPKVKEFEEAFAARVGAKHACAVSSCTAALHLALRALKVKPGDVVITVSHSFISTANCVRYCGAEPVFVDVDLDTYNISPSKLKECLEKECEARAGGLFYKNLSRLISRESPLRYLANGKPNPGSELGRPDKAATRRSDSPALPDGLGQPGQAATRRSDSPALPNGLGRVAAILVVHQMGMPCDLAEILSLAEEFRLPVVEDAACALGSEITLDRGETWDKIGRPHGDIACFSFHPLKVLTTGEGGMLTTNHPDYDRELRLLRHQGMSVSDLERHRSPHCIIEEYPEMGYNYRMTDIQAAIGLEQLKKLPHMVERRREIASFYQRKLAGVPWLRLPVEPPFAKTNWQSFPVRVLGGAPKGRNELMQYLRDRGVLTRPGIMNAHQEKPYAEGRARLENSETARNDVLILPLFCAMSDREAEEVVELIQNA
jgi:dTDP-4-amino-4,6-dideoxygalactose transaminase